jgi:hypothetical protein
MAEPPELQVRFSASRTVKAVSLRLGTRFFTSPVAPCNDAPIIHCPRARSPTVCLGLRSEIKIVQEAKW